ncbi:MAG: folate family ECF transporter S component [Ruminococcus sp.]|nr:folate family ECF transporter S component [Ruminococcus sp.]MCM1381090.1 folate family ECF transporter S component [Muribaculaceae bacterium]MCM1478682.1 folate family ECF transporter S component [Muribaculaceae bacterium]
MKGFLSKFKESAAELKSVRCLAVVGILTAMFVVLDVCSINIGGFIKLNFNFLALASAGMLFGPVPAAMAAVAGDLIGCIIGGQSPIPLLSCTGALSGLIYGVCLYKRDGWYLAAFSVIARVIDSLVVSLALNTSILMYSGLMSRTGAQLYTRCITTLIQVAVFAVITPAVMSAVKNIYSKVVKHRS